jgi:hypothetical protein
MSQQETTFIKWFASIAASLIVAMIIGIVTQFNMLNQFKAGATEKIKHNELRIEGLKSNHTTDIQYIQRDIKEIKSDLKEIKHDILSRND